MYSLLQGNTRIYKQQALPGVHTFFWICAFNIHDYAEPTDHFQTHF